MWQGIVWLLILNLMGFQKVYSQSMGHSSEAITKAYLEDFGSSVLEEAMKHLN